MLTSTTQPSVRARVLARFPAQVLAGAGITITRQGGAYIFSTVAVEDIPLSALADVPANTILGRGAQGAGPVMPATVAGGLVFTSSGNILQLSDNQRSRSFSVNFLAVAAGNQQDIVVPLACSLTRVTLLADVVGNAVVDILKTNFAGFPGSLVSICSATKPTLTTAQKVQDSTLTGWSKDFVAGDILRVGVNSVATITRLSVSLEALTI